MFLKSSFVYWPIEQEWVLNWSIWDPQMGTTDWTQIGTSTLTNNEPRNGNEGILYTHHISITGTNSLHIVLCHS